MRFLLLMCAVSAVAAPPRHGVRTGRLIIRNAMVVDGSGTPASGPKDIVIEGRRITDVIPRDPVAARQAPPANGAAEIDAKGKYVLPGLINAHGHVQEERGGLPQPLQYELNLWLACGITTVRDVGSDTRKTIALRDKSAAGEVAAPRLLVYARFSAPPSPHNAAGARARVREFKKMGADGIKLLGATREVMQAMQEEAHTLGLPIAHHAGVEETNAWDDIRFGTRSIEHWYGIPDAAIPARIQNFPASYNYNNETDRFRYAGRLWREADPKLLDKVLDGMVAAKVAWVPTLDIYEAGRDLQRAQTQPWFAEYLHPTLARYFQPNEANHGSFFFGWTSTDETYWKENYRLWMAAVRSFDQRGGVVGAGEDAGFIYQMYGYGLLRELELHQEAGFHPLQAIQHATANNARILGMEDQLGAVRPGYLADLIVVNGNPLADLKMLYPPGIEWTVKDGIPYHGPTLMQNVKAVVAAAKAR